jgi:hypothetical protein
MEVRAMRKKLALLFAAQLLLLGTSFVEAWGNKKEQDTAKSGIIILTAKQELQEAESRIRESEEEGERVV